MTMMSKYRRFDSLDRRFCSRSQIQRSNFYDSKQVLPTRRGLKVFTGFVVVICLPVSVPRTQLVLSGSLHGPRILNGALHDFSDLTISLCMENYSVLYCK